MTNPSNYSTANNAAPASGDLLTQLKHQAVLQGEKPAIVYNANASEHAVQQTTNTSSLSFNQFYSRACKTALFMQQQWRLEKNDRIAWLGFNHPDMFVLLFAAARLGVVVVPLNWRLSNSELEYIVSDCEPKYVIHDEQHAEKAALCVASTNAQTQTLSFSALDNAIRQSHTNTDTVEITEPNSEPDDDALIVYTSGTTGRPKGAVLAHKAISCNALMSQHMYALNSDDKILNVLPLFHIGGINIQPLPGLLFGATVYLHQQFNPVDAAQELTKSAITLINTVPTLLQAIMATTQWQQAENLKLKSVSIGSTDVPISLINAVHNKRIPLVQVYGATETGPIAIYQLREHATQTVGSIGIEGLHCQIKLVNTEGQEVGTNEAGEILVKGDNILSRYWKNKQASQTTIVDGWFRTGDIAAKDEHGFYWFKDRLKHVIISGGENIYPAEIERIVEKNKTVNAVSVVGIAHEKWGEVPVAVIECNNLKASGSNNANDTMASVKLAVLKLCEENLARFKQPKAVVVVDALPRNAMGKVLTDDVKVIVNNFAATGAIDVL